MAGVLILEVSSTTISAEIQPNGGAYMPVLGNYLNIVEAAAILGVHDG